MEISEFSRFVLPEVLGCPDPTLHQAIVMAAYEFCDHSGAWDELQAPVLTQVDVADYAIPAPAGAVALRVLDAHLDGFRLTPLTYRAGVAMATGSTPLAYSSAVERGQIRLHPTPGVAGGEIQIRAAYGPSVSATTLPDFLLQRYAEVIASGAKARLMSMPGVAWSQPDLSIHHAQRFQAGVLDARMESMYGRHNGSLRVEPRAFK